MKFRLLYEGEIAPRQKAKIEDIHAIRMALDAQLRALWQFPPLSISAPSLLRYKVEGGPQSALPKPEEHVRFFPSSRKRSICYALSILRFCDGKHPVN
jgi:hypothetical protein